MFQIQLISAEQTRPLRSKVLRPGLPIDQCNFSGDDDPETIHLGIFFEDELVGIATFMREPNSKFPQARFPYRLRGMATDSHLHRQGIGKKLILKAEEILKDKSCDLIWCNARESAFGFYRSLGFQFSGDLFEISGIGPHKVMYKFYDAR